MPPTARPDLPHLVEEAIDAFGNRVRVAVVRSLLDDGPAGRTTIASRLGLSRSLLQAHLRKLEELEVVYTSPRRSEPGRVHRQYHVDQRRLTELRNALAAVLTAADG